MKKEIKTYCSPALGCMVGSANQVLLTELEKALKEEKLHLSSMEYLVLRALYSKDGIQQCEIAEMVGRHKAGICRCISGLVKKDLVYTEPVSYKCLKIYLTDEARLLQSRVMKVANDRHHALLNIISAEDLEIFNKVLETIIKQNKKGNIK